MDLRRDTLRQRRWTIAYITDSTASTLAYRQPLYNAFCPLIKEIEKKIFFVNASHSIIKTTVKSHTYTHIINLLVRENHFLLVILLLDLNT